MKLYDHTGTQIGSDFTTTIATGSKASLSPASVTAVGTSNEFGYWEVNGAIVYAGSAVFTATGSTIAVVTRVLSMTPLGQSGEDFNGIPQ